MGVLSEGKKRYRQMRKGAGGNLVKLNGSKSQTKSESEKRPLARNLGSQNNEICDLLYGGSGQCLAYLTFDGEFRRGKGIFQTS